ncbi:uncharacterized protein C8R40DRAFT_1075436 [Lentinula edodes]|uniref:uncharacterized protein n=1 Tax=Lentinula edodes TaxID=5353 RepID=UPI001E8E2A94|nr:uncharacterized protein C8R40DRAFT_1075436 [Lentinula edodes]KAH7867646.1 hypothetical protein C8R40DRAFT_1075436 [Lentinula edodes]
MQAYQKSHAKKIDKHYNIEGAGQTADIRELCELKRDNANKKNKEWENSVKIIRFKEPDCWRIVWNDHKEGEDPQEVVFHMQGVVKSKGLLPMRRQSEKNKQKNCHTRQWIVVSGVGSNRFDQNCEGIMDVYAMFARLINGLGCIEFKFENGRRAVEVGSQIFTPKLEAPEMEWVEANASIDAHGFMQWVRSSDLGLVYGEDNMVKYSEELTNGSGKKRAADVTPQKIHVGDIVDIGFTMIGIEGNQNWSIPKVRERLKTLSDD